MSVNKVVVDDETALDLTEDTVNENTLLSGSTAHNAAGKKITGAVVVAPIDEELSEESENAVQNKAIAAELKKKISKESVDYELSEESENPVQNKAIVAELKKKISKESVDYELSEESENPLQNKVIASAIAELEKKIGGGTGGGAKVITGSYTGNGIAHYTGIKPYSASDGSVDVIGNHIVPETVNEDEVMVNIGATPSAVLISQGDTLKDSGLMYISDTVYQKYVNNIYSSTLTKDCYVIQKDGANFTGANGELATSSFGNSQTFKYSFSNSKKLTVVSDDTTPTASQIRISDLQGELLLNENTYYGNNNVATVTKKTIDDVYVGQIIYGATLNQNYYFYPYRGGKIIENGFVPEYNTAGTTYQFVAFVKC